MTSRLYFLASDVASLFLQTPQWDVDVPAESAEETRSLEHPVRQSGFLLTTAKAPPEGAAEVLHSLLRMKAASKKHQVETVYSACQLTR